MLVTSLLVTKLVDGHYITQNTTTFICC